MDFWQTIIANDYALPAGLPLLDLTDTLIGYLGSPDPHLRHEIGYSVLNQWIVRGSYTPDQCRALLPALSANFQHGLGENGTESVFLRSFSALTLASLLFRDQQHPFLAPGEVVKLLHTTIDYLADEKDLRGYIPEQGWAHSAAHTADLLLLLAQQRHLDGNHLAHLVYAIADKVKRKTGYIFIHEEDERLGRAALAAFARPVVSLSIMEAWIVRLLQVFDDDQMSQEFDTLAHSAYFNTKTFMRSVYLQLCLGEENPASEALKTRLLEAFKAFPH